MSDTLPDTLQPHRRTLLAYSLGTGGRQYVFEKIHCFQTIDAWLGYAIPRHGYAIAQRLVYFVDRGARPGFPQEREGAGHVWRCHRRSAGHDQTATQTGGLDAASGGHEINQ